MGVLGHAVLGQSVLGQPEAAAVAALLTWQQIQDHLGVPAGGTQAEYEALAGQVLSVLEGKLGRPLAVRTVTQRDAGCHHGREIVLDALPCPCTVCRQHSTITITTLTVDGGTVDAAELRIDAPLLRWRVTGAPSSAWADQGVTAVYESGYASAPPWLTLAGLRLAEHLWQKTQQAPHPALGQVGGGYDEGEPVLIDALPYSVQSLIEDHAVLGFA